MAGLLTKGIKLSYCATSTGTYTEIPGLMEVPDLGAAPEKVEVTTLADGNKRYINGIKDYGDLSFKFLYDNDDVDSSYRICKGLSGITYFKVEFPDAATASTGHGTTFAFAGETSTTVSSAAVNAALEFTLNIALNSDITVSDPT